MVKNQFWRLARVVAETGLSRAGVYEGMAEGTFPQSFKIQKRSVAWLSDEVEAWKMVRLAKAGRALEAA